MRRISISLSDELHEELRREALRHQISTAEVIRVRIQAPAKVPSKGKAVTDPLLKVAGICVGRVLSVNIDDELGR
jgi:hypothetical protein